MAKFDNIKAPKAPTTPFHITNDEAVFVEGEEYPVSNAVVINKRLDIATNLIVLEECVGFEGKWSKVLIDDNSGNYGIAGFVPHDKISPLNDAKPSIICNLSPNNLPNNDAPDINWREESTNRMFEDAKRGVYSVLYDTGIEKLNNNIEEVMITSLYAGLQIIFQETGKQYTLDQVKAIQDSKYLFGTAEAIDASLRKCSTIRVLVSVPKKYMNSEDFPIATGEIVPNPDILGELPDVIPSSINQDNKYLDLLFDNYEQYEQFFRDISYESFKIPLGALNKGQTIFSSRDWMISPAQVRVQLDKYYQQINEVKEKIDILIIKNTPPEYAKEILFQNDNWQGKLAIKIDYKDLKIVYMKFETSTKVQIPLNIGVVGFLNDQTVNSKTIVNYILQRHLSWLKREYYIELRRQKIKKDIAGKGFDELKKDIEKRGLIDVLILTEQQFIEQYAISDSFIDPPKDDVEKNELAINAKTALKKYFNSFLNEEFSKELEEVEINSDIQDDFIELLEIADFSAVAQSAVNMLKAVVSDENNETTGPQSSLSKFLLKYHYPKLTSVEPMPLDVTKCVLDQEQAMRSFSINKSVYVRGEYQKISSQLNKYNSNLEFDVLKRFEREGDEIIKAVTNFPYSVKDRNLRLLLGVDKPPDGTKTFKALNEYYLPALRSVEMNGILAEVIKCSAINVDPSTFNDLLNKYQNAKRALEDFASTTACNPFLAATMKQLNGIQLPVLPVYNPNRNLANELLNMILDTIQRILVMTVRNLLTQALKNCLKDPNKEKNANSLGSADDITDNLNNNSNDPVINDSLDDLFGINSDLSPEELRAARDSAREKLLNLMDKVLCVLSTKELCSLLNNVSVSADTYEVIISIIRNKFPELSNTLRTYEDIQILFAKLGTVVDPRACYEVDNPVISGNKIPVCSLCDDGTLQDARRKLLENKNIPSDVIDDIINDIKESEAKNLENILKFLDSDSPFDFSNVPSVLCKKGPNGEVIPPQISVAAPIDSFKDLINTLFADLYKTFNDEALQWSKTTYSVSSSAPRVMKFENGKISVDNSSIETLKNQDGAKASYAETTLPAYLFNGIIEKDVNDESKIYSVASSDATGSYTFKVPLIDGDLQQQLDANIINSALRSEVEAANAELSKFIGKFLFAFEIGMGVSVIKSAESPIDLSKRIVPNLVAYLAIFDNFIRKNPNQMDNVAYPKLLETFGSNAESNAALFEENGFDLYIKIMSFMKSNKDKMNDLFKAINDTIPSTYAGANTYNGTIEYELSTLLNNNIAIYDRVSGYYKTVLNSNLKYPRYNLIFTDNYHSASLNGIDLYDSYALKITKNNEPSPYIFIQDYEKIDEELENFISKDLSIAAKTLDKKHILEQFLKKYNPEIDKNTDYEQLYNSLTKYVYQIPIANIRQSLFLKKRMLNEAQSSEGIATQAVEKAYTDYLKLVINPTPAQIACGVNPHYLDIDSIKDDAVENKKNSQCADELLKDTTENNKPVDAENLQNMETTDTQNILLSATYRLVLRLYAHDIILRGIGIFGYFDPQILRDDSLFVDYLANTIESEVRGIDTNLFHLMSSFFAKQYKLMNPNDINFDEKNIAQKRQVIKNILRDELRNAILPKLSKRIQDDTNNILRKSDLENDKLFRLKFINTGTDLKNIISEAFRGLPILVEILEEDSAVYLKVAKEKTKESSVTIVTGYSPFTAGMNIQQGSVVNYEYEKYKIFDGTLADFNDSKQEFKLLFQLLFPLKRYISTLFITNALCTATRKQILDAFKQSKKSLRRLAIAIQTNGEGANFGLKNPQNVLSDDANDDIASFIFNVFISIPRSIAKGFIEGSDPNAALASGIYKVAKAFEPSLSSIIVPTIGVPLMFWPLSPFMANPLNILYYATGLWYEKASMSDSEEEKSKYLDSLFTEAAQIDCIPVRNHSDIIRIGSGQKDYYKKSVSTSNDIEATQKALGNQSTTNFEQEQMYESIRQQAKSEILSTESKSDYTPSKTPAQQSGTNAGPKTTQTKETKQGTKQEEK